MSRMGLERNSVNRIKDLNKRQNTLRRAPRGQEEREEYFSLITSHHRTGWASPQRWTSRAEQTEGIDALKKKLDSKIFIYVGERHLKKTSH